ncbi:MULTISPECIES: YjbQ family protein [unclassified Neptuniibacter]|uniref:YjbQ family protein n=1 Tax=unclassified Neptuniibacter TaxID=2630693 RepID=UPI000C4A8FCF|nr:MULTISPECIES: YjbQ family protein [unclassified Neptuniibacter]MAY43540.1 hypothetical protein [Oceanospirillaceae bacterium]
MDIRKKVKSLIGKVFRRPHEEQLIRITDMPAHIKSALTATSLSIPIFQGRLCLGTWQGVFCWEHRHSGGKRK